MLVRTFKSLPKIRPETRARFVRRTMCTLLDMPPAWLPMTHTPLSRDAARIMSKLDTVSRVTS